jgi:hypothetical protein
MASRVVCVSRTLGAGGDEVARAVADQLGFRYVDDEIVVRAAEAAGVSPETIEKTEHTPSLVARVMDALGTVPIVADAGVAIVMPAYPTVNHHKMIERVIHQTASEGNVVIVAHGASIPLAGEAGVLRVLVTASPAVRAARITAQAGDERAAKKTIEDSDRDREQFLRRFYGIDHEHPTHFDLTISTDALTVEQAARLVVAAARG